MKIFILDPNYPNSGTIDERFRDQLARELESEFGEVNLIDVDAGPGASEPGYFLEIVGHVANIVGLVLAVPVIWSWLPTWKEKLDRVVSFLLGKKLTFSVDAQSAENLAAFYVLNKIGGGYKELNIVSITRHFSVVGMLYSEDISPTTIATDLSSIDNHQQAVKQQRSRHVVGVQVDALAFTVIIESDGRCGYIEQVGH